MNLVYPPPRILHNHFSNFSLVLQSSQEKSKTMVVQFFFGEKKVHYGICESCLRSHGNSDVYKTQITTSFHLYIKGKSLKLKRSPPSKIQSSHLYQYLQLFSVDVLSKNYGPSCFLLSFVFRKQCYFGHQASWNDLCLTG